MWSYNPRLSFRIVWFGLFRFRSPLLSESLLISLPLGTEMFQFPRFASRLRGMTDLATRRVSPFGHPGIDACVPLPLASRSLPRPSSPPCAQASTTCLHSLDYFIRCHAAHSRSTLSFLSRRLRWLAPPDSSEVMRIHYPTISQPSLVKQRPRRKNSRARRGF